MFRILAAVSAVMFTTITPQISKASSICVEQGSSKCYCTGLGCRRFCRGILTTGQGSSSSADPGGTLSVGPAPMAKVVDGLFDGPVAIISPRFSGSADAIAVVGTDAAMARGRAKAFVLDGNRARSVGRVRLRNLQISQGDVAMPMSAVRSLFDAPVERLN